MERDKKEITGKGVNGNLIPPVKGEVRNPKGRGAGNRDFKTIYMAAIKKIADSQDMTPKELEELLVQSGLKNALKGDYRFYQDVMDRIHGKPKQGVEIEGSGEDGAIEVRVKMV